jgi:hypothetical protein
MIDLPRRRRETFFILEGDGASARVLHRESNLAGRTTLHDHACQLPVDDPIPWSVVTVDDEVFVLTRSGLDAHDRWLLAADDLRRVDGWTADVLELF